MKCGWIATLSILAWYFAVLTPSQGATALFTSRAGAGIMHQAGGPQNWLHRATLRLDRSGRFELQFAGDYGVNCFGMWYQTGEGMYDLSVTQAVGTSDVSGTGRLIAGGFTLHQLELSGQADGRPFHISFATNGSLMPVPAADGYSLGRSSGLWLGIQYYYAPVVLSGRYARPNWPWRGDYLVGAPVVRAQGRVRRHSTWRAQLPVGRRRILAPPVSRAGTVARCNPHPAPACEPPHDGMTTQGAKLT